MRKKKRRKERERKKLGQKGRGKWRKEIVRTAEVYWV